MPEMEFRDGKHNVADHVRDLLGGLDTHQFTYKEAVQLAEKKLLKDRLNEMQSNVIQKHFREWR
jgi:hypothetical protein